MIYPDPTTTADPQWANIIPNTIAIVEMDIGIIAASLVVMRPCFVAIYHIATGRKPPGSTIASKLSGYGVLSGSTRTRSGRVASRDEKIVSQTNKVIVRTMDIELESRTISMEEF